MPLQHLLLSQCRHPFILPKDSVKVPVIVIVYVIVYVPVYVIVYVFVYVFVYFPVLNVYGLAGKYSCSIPPGYL